MPSDGERRHDQASREFGFEDKRISAFVATNLNQVEIAKPSHTNSIVFRFVLCQRTP